MQEWGQCQASWGHLSYYHNIHDKQNNRTIRHYLEHINAQKYRTHSMELSVKFAVDKQHHGIRPYLLRHCYHYIKVP
jgi:hypothetical protein